MDLPFSRSLGETVEGAARYRNSTYLQGFKHSGLRDVIVPLSEQPGYQTDGKEYLALKNQLSKEAHYKMYCSTQTRAPAPL